VSYQTCSIAAKQDMLIISQISIKKRYEAEKESNQHLKERIGLPKHFEYTDARLAQLQDDIEAKKEELDEIDERIENRSEIEEKLHEFEELEEENGELERQVEEPEGGKQELEEQKEELEGKLEKSEPFEGLEGRDAYTDWSGQLIKEVNGAWDDRLKSRYRRVKVLMVQWASDDLGVSSEIDQLGQVFTHVFK